jgi:hypothetical protein
MTAVCEVTSYSHFALDGQNYLELEEYLSNKDDEDIILVAFLHAEELWSFPDDTHHPIGVKTVRRGGKEWDFTMIGHPQSVKGYLHQVSRDPRVSYVGIKSYLYPDN